MALISLAEYAQAKNISLRRAQQLAAGGQIEAKKIGRSWVADSSVLARPRRKRRALSHRSAYALSCALEQNPLAELSHQEQSRLSQRLSALHGDDAPELIRDWMSSRHLEVQHLAANRRDLPRLLSDKRVRPGGISDPRSHLSSGSEAELYVSLENVDLFSQDWMLVDSELPNVRMHVVLEIPEHEVPIAWIMADLADEGGPRELQRVRELIQG